MLECNICGKYKNESDFSQNSFGICFECQSQPETKILQEEIKRSFLKSIELQEEINKNFCENIKSYDYW